jgi:hypothetical protein
MANPHHAQTLARFDATVQKSQNRLVAIPADLQRRLGLVRQPNNFLVTYSIRQAGEGPWFKYVSYLTEDNEFTLPAGAPNIEPGDSVEVKIHRFTKNEDAALAEREDENGGALLVRLAAMARPAFDDARSDGSERLDDYLNQEIGGK